MKNIIFLLSALFYGLNLQNCDRNDELNIVEASCLDPDFKAYLYFEDGTWWVYEDNTTGELDSQWVTNSSINITRHAPGSRERDGQSIDTIVRKSFSYNLLSNQHSHHYFVGATNRCGSTPEDDPDHNCFLAQYRRSNQQNEIISTAFMVYHPKAGDYIYPEPDASDYSSQTLDVMDSFQVNGHSFGKSIQVQINNDPNDLISKTKIISISKNVGITQIKYKTDDTETYPSGWQIWNLTSYHIV